MRAADNPFRSERVLGVRYRLQAVTWEDLLGRWESLGRRAALIGPHGSGKTTLLEDWVPRLRARGFSTCLLRLDAEQRRFSPEARGVLGAALTPRHVVLLDGAEQLDWLAWQSFRWRCRRAAGLIVTTHRSGRLPTLWECRTSPELLTGIVAELLNLSAIPPDLAAQAHQLYRRHDGNLREALRTWYDLTASDDESNRADGDSVRSTAAPP